MAKSEKDRAIEPSNEIDYNLENVAKLMIEEEHGIHISLINSGDIKNGLPQMNIIMETDLNQKTVKNIMEGLLNRYVEVEEK